MKQNLNNDALYSIANVLDSNSLTPYNVCNSYLSGYIPVRNPRPQTYLKFPESRTLVSLGVFRVGGIFF